MSLDSWDGFRQVAGMKLTVPLFVFALALPASADLVIEQEVETGGQTMEIVMKVKGDLLRMDMGDQTSIIINTATGDIVNILHGQKMVMRMAGEQLKAIVAQAPVPAQSIPSGGLTATGETSTINGFQTKHYVQETPNGPIEFWIAENMENAGMLVSQFAALSKNLSQYAPGGSGTVEIDPDQFPGFPIRTIVNSGPGGKIVSTVTRLEQTELTAADFEVPEGYQSMQMPVLPMGGLQDGN